MSKILKSFYQTLFPRASVEENQYPDLNSWVEGLRAMETPAIVLLMTKAEPAVRQIVRRMQLPETATADLLHDSVMILVKKIRDQSFDVSQSAPPTYIIGVAKKLAANTMRRQQQRAGIEPLQGLELPDRHFEDYLENKQRRELLEHLLGTLGEPCAQLIRLKYLDGFRDEEILTQNLTHYKTPMALRSKRSQCFQKLMELAASTKKLYKTISA